MEIKARYWGPRDRHISILRNAAKYMRMVEGRPYKLQWRGVHIAESLCKQVGVDISEALGSGLYPNIGAAHDVVNEAISNLTQKGTK